MDAPRTIGHSDDYDQKMVQSVWLYFSGGTKPGLHVGGQIKSKAKCPTSTIY